MFDGLGSSSAHIKSGRSRALGTASQKRAPGFADLPACSEQGLPNYQVSTWYGLWAPKGTPKEIVERMEAEMHKAFATAELELAGIFPDLDSSVEGPTAAPESLRGAQLASERGWTAPAMPDTPPAFPALPEKN